MNVGAFFDKIIMLSFGIYMIYLSKTKKEKLGDKAALVRFGGIILIGMGIINMIIALFEK